MDLIKPRARHVVAPALRRCSVPHERGMRACWINSFQITRVIITSVRGAVLSAPLHGRVNLTSRLRPLQKRSTASRFVRMLAAIGTPFRLLTVNRQRSLIGRAVGDYNNPPRGLIDSPLPLATVAFRDKDRSCPIVHGRSSAYLEIRVKVQVRAELSRAAGYAANVRAYARRLIAWNVDAG
jgi:hypothetical protein